MSDPNNIIPFSPEGGQERRLSEDRLMQYLEGKLSPAEQHEVELWLAGEGMESDALEGLQPLAPAETRQAVSKLNHQLRKSLQKKKPRRRTAKAELNTLIAIALILLLVIIAYIVVRRSI